MPAFMATTTGAVMSVQQQACGSLPLLQQQQQQQQDCEAFPLLSMQQPCRGGPSLVHDDGPSVRPPPGVEQRSLRPPEGEGLQGPPPGGAGLPFSVRDFNPLPQQQQDPNSGAGLRFLLNAELLVGDPDCAMVRARPPATLTSNSTACSSLPSTMVLDCAMVSESALQPHWRGMKMSPPHLGAAPPMVPPSLLPSLGGPAPILTLPPFPLPAGASPATRAG